MSPDKTVMASPEQYYNWLIRKSGIYYLPGCLLLGWSKNQSSVTQLLIDYIPGHHGELCGGELHSVLDDTLTGASLVPRNSRGRMKLYDGDIVGRWNLEQNQCFNF